MSELPIPVLIARVPGLTGPEKLVLWAVASHLPGPCTVTREALAVEASMSVPTLKRVRSSLRSQGLITTEDRRPRTMITTINEDVIRAQATAHSEPLTAHTDPINGSERSHEVSSEESKKEETGTAAREGSGIWEGLEPYSEGSGAQRRARVVPFAKPGTPAATRARAGATGAQRRDPELEETVARVWDAFSSTLKPEHRYPIQAQDRQAITVALGFDGVRLEDLLKAVKGWVNDDWTKRHLYNSPRFTLKDPGVVFKFRNLFLQGKSSNGGYSDWGREARYRLVDGRVQSVDD